MKYFFLLFCLFTPLTSHADLGPKPSMKFQLIYETSKPVTLLEAEQIECEDNQCLKSKPLGKMGPQRFWCQQDSCASSAYSYKPFHKLILRFSDGRTRESPIFEAKSFNASFKVTVTDSALKIEETTPFIHRGGETQFLKALILTLILELLAAYLFLYIAKLSRRILLTVVVANLLSLPFVWFAFPLWMAGGGVVFVAELFAVFFEALLIYLLHRKQLSLKKALGLSLVTNMTSFFLGGLLLILTFLIPG